MDKLSAMHEKWKINKVHFRDLNLEVISQRKAYVLNGSQMPVLVPFLHLFKLRDQLFIMHDNLTFLYKENNLHMTISHLRTGQCLFNLTLKEEKLHIEEIEAKAKEFLEDAISRLSERYVMERIKSNQAVNVKYKTDAY